MISGLVAIVFSFLGTVIGSFTSVEEPSRIPMRRKAERTSPADADHARSVSRFSWHDRPRRSLRAEPMAEDGRRPRSERTPTDVVGASALLLALTLVGFFDYYTWLLAPGRLWQWLAWGLWAAAYRSALPENAYA